MGNFYPTKNTLTEPAVFFGRFSVEKKTASSSEKPFALWTVGTESNQSTKYWIVFVAI
jgi:hypothetical protein